MVAEVAAGPAVEEDAHDSPRTGPGAGVALPKAARTGFGLVRRKPANIRLTPASRPAENSMATSEPLPRRTATLAAATTKVPAAMRRLPVARRRRCAALGAERWRESRSAEKSAPRTTMVNEV